MAVPSIRWQLWISVLTICILSQYAIASAEASCKKGCSKSETGVLRYAPGSVYEYNFDSVMTIAVGSSANGGESDDTGLKVVGNAKLFAEGNCGYTLQIGAVKVTATKEGNVEKRITQTITKPVHFTMTDGRLEPEICADSSDDIYSLNIKRAVISLLQSSHNEESKPEIDVFGQCTTHTTVSKSGSADIISKMRNLNKCAYREHLISGIVNGVVNEKAGIKTTMLLQADYAKEAKVESGIIQDVHLVENYHFTGSPKTGGNAKAKVTTNMKLKNVGNSPAPPVGDQVSSLIFQKSDIHASKNLAAIKGLMTEIVQSNGDYVKKDSAKKFVELIRLMRNADAATLLELGSVPFQNKVLGRRVYLDGLFRAGTAESARAILKQFGKLNDKEQLLGMLSLNLVQVVDKETIAQISALLTPTAPKEVYLAVGSLVSKYCKKQNCDTLPEVQGIAKKLADALKHCKAGTKKDEERILHALKGIGNSHNLALTAAPVLTECVAPGHPLRLRVAALQAFSSASCSDVLRQKAMQVLRDHNEDSELRIEAYLALVECPNAALSNEIAEIVNNEPINQVGGFIASHLRALRDSTDDHREQQRLFLGNIRVTKQFPTDFRRFSYNNELSYRLDALGVSASADYKLIYSQHGFLPRSGRFNVSSEIFGMNFNVFEGSIRQDNLENVLEYYLAPKGLINKDFDEIIKGKNVGRARRSIADESNKFAKKYKDYGSKNIDDLNLDFSVKLFGSEMLFLSMGDHIPNTLDDLIGTVSMMFDGLKQEVSNFQKEFNMHNLFLDTELVYPTGLGLPLELSAQGLAANKLDFGIGVDVDAIIGNNWQKAKYRLKVVPSVDVNVDFRIGFNAFVLSTGLRVSSSLHSATGADMNLAFINEDAFTLDIQLPREELELVNLKLETDFYVGEQEKQLKTIAPKVTKKSKADETHMCFDQLKSMGFTVCYFSHVLIPEKAEDRLGPQSWLYPFSAGLSVSTERNYHFKGSHEEKPGTKLWKLDFSTPGSQESHDTSLAFELGIKPRAFGRVSLDFPQNHFALEAGFNNDDKEFVLYAQYENNDDLKKNKIGFEKHGNEYKPLIAIQGRNGELERDINGYTADGRVIVQKTDDKHARYNFENFQVVNSQKNERLVVNGWVEVGPTELTTELRIAPAQESFLVKSHFKIENGDYEFGTFVNNEKTPDNVIGGSAHLKIADGNVGATLVGKAQSWEVLFKNNVQYVKPEGINMLQSSKFESEFDLKKKQQTIVAVSVDGFTEGEDKLGFNVKATHGKSVASLAVKFQENQRAQHDYLLELNGKYNKHFVDVFAKCDVSGNHFVVDNTLSTSWGTAFTVKGQLGQRYTPQDILIDLQGSAQLNSKDKPSQFVFKVIGAPEKTLTDVKLMRDNQELVKFNAETQHPQDKISNGKLNLIVKNILVTKADFKIAKNGKGDLNAHIETLRTEPKHKVDVSAKFHIQAPKYDVESTLVLDGDKKIFIKTENQFEKTKMVTKNIVDVGDKKLTFDANGNVKGADVRSNSEITGSFVLNSPTGHVVDGTIKRKLATNPKTNVAQGTMEVQLNEQFEGKKRSLHYNGKLERLNVKTKDISLDTVFDFVDADNKKLNVKCHVKHLPKGNDKHRIDFAIVANGELIGASPYEFALLVDEYDAKHAVVRVNGKYGNEANANINGNYNLGERSEPSTFALQANLQAPNADYKQWEINANGKYQKPENEDGVGNRQLELHIDEKVSGKSGQQFVKLNTVYRGSRQQGSYSFDVQTERMQGPLKIEGSHQQELGSDPSGQNGKRKFSSNFSYGDKYLRSSIDIVKSESDKNFKLHYVLDSSLESARQVDFQLQAHELDSESFAADSQMKLNGNEYALNSKYYKGVHKKGVDLKVKIPQSPKEIVVYSVFEILGERKAKLTAKIDNLAEFDFNGEVESAYKDIDNFYITGNWNSERLHLNKYSFDFRSQNKAISIDLKNAEGPIINGKAAYALKNERNKAIIEGQGQVQYKGKSHNTNFKLIRQVYDANTDKEIGFSYTFNGNFGPKNGVSTFKITNKDFNLKLSICEEKKQCTNVQVQSQITAADGSETSFPIESMQHSLLVLIDFRELGYPYEFELQSKTIRQGFKVTYNLDSHIISNNNLKYQFVVNVLPNTSKLSLKLPNREILFETQSQHPENGWLGKYVNSAAFYLDKARKPNDVTRLLSTIDITGIENGFAALNAKGEMRFEHPTIRPLIISGKADLNRQQQVANVEMVFDIFRSPDQKLVASSHIENSKRDQKGFNITSTQQIHSQGLDLQYEFHGHTAYDIDHHEFSAAAEVQAARNEIKSNIWLYSNKDRLEFTISALNEPIVNVNGEFIHQKHGAKFNSKFYLFGQKPYEVNTEVQPSFAKFELNRAGLAHANVEFKLGKEIKFNAEGGGKPLVDGKVALDAANFLQTTYTSNKENIKQFLDQFEAETKKESTEAYEKIKQRVQKLRQVMERHAQLSKDSVPDFTQFWANYEASLKDLVSELEQDPALKKIADSFRAIYTKLAKIAADVTKTWSEAFERLHKSFVQLNEKFQAILNETIIPAWEQFAVTATKIIGELRVEFANWYTKAFEVLMSIVEKYGPAIKNYSKAIYEAVKPYNESLQELYKIVAHAIDEFIDELKEWIARLPTFEAVRAEFKTKLDQMKIGEKALDVLNNIFEQLHILPTTPETYAFLERLHNYLEAKLKDQPVNDNAVLEELAKLLLKAVRSVLSTIELNLPLNSAGSASDGIRAFLAALPSSFDFLSDWPGFLSFRFSIFNFIMNEDWASLIKEDYLQKWVYYHDFNLHGHIADGQHIFTFDGQYLPFRGNCKYILAQDSKDNNFTVIATLNNGKLKSIVLADRDGLFMEINDNGALKSNGNPTEYPAHEAGGMHAWRKYYTVWMLSEYGAQVMCTSDLKICHVDVNGFYTSKTRGLFGNGNAEPYDDFIQVDGTIAPDGATFGNGYGLGKCNPVGPPAAEVPHQEVCSEIFGVESPLAYWYLIENARPYRKACDQAVQDAAEKDKETTACNIALAYGSAVAIEHQFSILPSRCLKCPGAPGQRDLYQEFTVKIPNNKADVVFVVDTGVTPAVMNNLVAPAITEIRDTLKSRGFTDVQIGVVAYNETQRYPAILTSDNGKLNYNGNLATLQLNGPKHFCDGCFRQMITEKSALEIYEIFEKIIKFIVPQSDEKAFGLALNYPFRAGAAKSIVEVRGNTLEYGNALKWLRASLAEAVTDFDGAILHLIAPVQGMSLEGIPAEKLIGFNSRLVATLDGKDAKKRQKLQFDTDMGIDFVLNSGGWVFGTQNFDSLKPAEQKKALNQVTSSIADTLFKTEIVSDCRCLPVGGLHANHYCTVKSSNFLPNKKAKPAA